MVRLNDRDTRFPQILDRLAELGLKSACTLPLSTAHRRLGSLSFASHVEDAYSPDELRFLSLVANQIALAIDDARAQKRLKLLLDLTWEIKESRKPGPAQRLQIVSPTNLSGCLCPLRVLRCVLLLCRQWFVLCR